MTVYSTAYASGVIDSVSGAVVTVSGINPVAAHVGRFLYLSSGAGARQFREILSFSGQNYTLSHSFDTNPFIDLSVDSRGTDVNPVATDTFVISYDADDLIAGDADLTLTDVNHLNVAAMTVQSGAVVHFKRYHIETDTKLFKRGSGGGFIFGGYNPVTGEDGYTKDCCDFVDTAAGTSGDQTRINSGSCGTWDMHGGSLYSTNGNFWRGNEDASSTGYHTRLFDVKIFGNQGGRIDGPKSIIKVDAVGDDNANGIFNILSAPHRVEVSALSCRQAVYLSLLFGPAGRAVCTRLADITTTIIRIVSGASTGAGLIYEVLGKKSEIDLAPNFLTIDSPGDASHTVRYCNLVKPKFIKTDLSPLSGITQTSLIDSTSAIVNTEAVVDGIYTQYLARHTDIPSTTGNKTLADGTQYAPYLLNSYKYGYQISSVSIDLEDTYNPSIIFLVDTVITEATKATVIAYTSANDVYRLYDVAAAWLEDNHSGQSSMIVDRIGTTVDIGSSDIEFVLSGSDFDFDGSLISVLVDTEFNGNITTTGNVFADNIDFTDIEIDGNLVFTTAGTYSFSGCTIYSMTNTSGGSVTIEAANCTFTNTPDPGEDITIVAAPAQIEITIIDEETESAIPDAKMFMKALAGGSLAVGDVILGPEVAGIDGIVSGAIAITLDQPFEAMIVESVEPTLYYPKRFIGTISVSSGYTNTIGLSRD